jgi:hypothetical protein
MYSLYPDDFNESAAPDITAWKLARSAIEHENDLINHRMTWFFSAQAFLLGVFFLALTSDDSSILRQQDNLIFLPIVLGLIGLLAIFMCGATSNGLDRAYLALDRITRHYVKLAKAHNFKRTPPLHAWGKPRILNTLYVPRVTLILWVVLEICCAAIFVSSSASAYLRSISLETYLAISSALVSFFGVWMQVYLSKIRSATRAVEPRYWESDPEGQFFNPDA